MIIRFWTRNMYICMSSFFYSKVIFTVSTLLLRSFKKFLLHWVELKFNLLFYLPFISICFFVKITKCHRVIIATLSFLKQLIRFEDHCM